MKVALSDPVPGADEIKLRPISIIYLDWSSFRRILIGFGWSCAGDALLVEHIVEHIVGHCICNSSRRRKRRATRCPSWSVIFSLKSFQVGVGDLNGVARALLCFLPSLDFFGELRACGFQVTSCSATSHLVCQRKQRRSLAHHAQGFEMQSAVHPHHRDTRRLSRKSTRLL